MNLSPTQVELARHALGLPNHGRRSFRNRFVTGPGGPKYDAWMAMVEAGAATRRPAGSDDGKLPSMDWFYLTRAGAEAVLKRGERLDPEDFPKLPLTES